MVGGPRPVACLFGGSVDLMMVMVKMLHDDGNLAAPHLMNPVAARFGILGLGVAMRDSAEMPKNTLNTLRPQTLNPIRSNLEFSALSQP